MQSSRMHTVLSVSLLLGVGFPWGCVLPRGGGFPGGVASQGVCFPGVCASQGVLPRGCASGGVPAQVLPHGQTDMCKNITFATSLGTVINLVHIKFYSLYTLHGTATGTGNGMGTTENNDSL